MKTCQYGVYEKIDEKPTVAHVQYCKECGNCIEECPNGCISFKSNHSQETNIIPFGTLPSLHRQ